jgi:hypothetical protein
VRVRGACDLGRRTHLMASTHDDATPMILRRYLIPGRRGQSLFGDFICKKTRWNQITSLSVEKASVTRPMKTTASAIYGGQVCERMRGTAETLIRRFQARSTTEGR